MEAVSRQDATAALQLVNGRRARAEGVVGSVADLIDELTPG